jgi:hypothetical protein
MVVNRGLRRKARRAYLRLAGSPDITGSYGGGGGWFPGIFDRECDNRTTMQRMWFSFLLLASSALWPQIATGESLDSRLAKNHSKLKVTLKLDREEYFPGEIAELTITIQNPTSEKLQVRKPFTPETGTLDLLEKNNIMAKAYGLEYGPIGAGPYVIEVAGTVKPPEPTVRMKPGVTFVRRFHSYDRGICDVSDCKAILAGSAPPRAGEFRLTYWGGHVDFRVVMPVFEGMTSASLSKLLRAATVKKYKTVLLSTLSF